jgi:Holliday junction resolvase RusA-like endonuclease
MTEKSRSHTDDLVVLELKGQAPSKKNRHRVLYNSKTHKPFVRSDEKYQNWETGAHYQLALQRGHFNIDFPIKRCEYIKVILYYGDKRKRDNSNVIESIHDALVAAKIIVDDNWLVTGTTIQEPRYRAGEPGCLIEIKLLKGL